MPKILVVDDEASARDLLTTLMRYAGHEVIEASDGVQALELARKTHPDLIITDIVMPTTDGYEFVRQLRQDPAIGGTNVIFNSATYNEREACALAHKCGVAHVMHKPSDPQEILRVVQTALGLEPVAPANLPGFDQEHLALVTNKLAEKVRTLEIVGSRLQALIDLSQETALIRDTHLLFDKFCRSARQMMSAKYAGGILFCEGKEEIEYFTLAGAADAIREQIGKPAVTEMFRTLARSSSPLRDVDFERHWRSRILPHHPLVYSFLGSSILGPRGCYGVIYAANKIGADGFDEEEVALIKTLSSRLAVYCENARLYEDLRVRAAILEDYTLQLKNLSKRLMDVREDEQRHIARELHDEIGQGLTALKIHLETAERRATDEAQRAQIAESLQIAETTLQQVRSLSLEMRPSILDDLGLVPALRWMLDRQAQLGRYMPQFAADPDQIKVPNEVKTACYRIVQESLTNILKHARAKTVSLRLRHTEEGLFVTIEDDGAGYAVHKARKRAVSGGSVGLLGMEERANLAGGRLAIESEPGKGTTVSVHFPECRRDQI